MKPTPLRNKKKERERERKENGIIKIPYTNLWRMRTALSEFSKQTTMPMKYAYKFGKAAKVLLEEIDLIDQQRTKCVKKYLKKGEKSVNPKKEDAFWKEFNTFLEGEEDFELQFEKISIEEMDDETNGEVKIQTNHMIFLEPLFTE